MQVNFFSKTVLLPLVGWLAFSAGGCAKRSDQAKGEVRWVTLVRVIDGDTVLVSDRGREQRLRLCCVDTPQGASPFQGHNTPEGVAIAKWAADYLRGQEVYIELSKAKPVDEYGRWLGYLWLVREPNTLEDDENFNLTLVREGLSKYVLKWGPSEFWDDAFQEAQRQARLAKKGVWAQLEKPAK